MYHFSYFIILITGCYDNIAWILNYVYRLDFSLNDSSKFNVGLQKKKENKKNKFYINLNNSNHEIADFFLSDNISGLINSVYPIRDSLQHRNFLKQLFMINGNKRTYLIELPEVKGLLDKIYAKKNFGFEKEISLTMKKDYYNICKFSIDFHANFIDFINKIFSIIKVDEIYPMTKVEINEIEKYKSAFLTTGLYKIGESIPY